MAFRIYTKTGDKGNTSLIGGTKVLKSHLRIEAYGNVDELNSYLGLCRDLIATENERNLLREIQDRLFTIGSTLACDPEKETKLELPGLVEGDINLLEQEIDKMDQSLPEMKNFIIPGGHPAVSHLHIARCVCRRAERSCVRLQVGSPVDAIVIKYLNRLSDYLFVLARFKGMQLSVEEIPWRARVTE